MAVFDPDAFIARLARGAATRRYETGEVIFAEGDVANSIFYLRSGMVKATVESEKQRGMIGVLDEGQFFGEACLNDVRRRLSTATAMIPSAVIEVSKETMQTALNDPAVAQPFISYLISRNGRVESDLRDKLFNSGEQRLARLLIQLSHYVVDGAPRKIAHEINQEMLAEMIGTSRQTVNTYLTKFRRLDLIRYNGGIEVRKGLLDMVLREKPLN